MKFIPNLELGSARAVFPEPSFLQLMQRLLLMVILVILALICSTSVTTLAYSSNTSEGWPLLHTSQTLASAVTSSSISVGRVLPVRLCLPVDFLPFVLPFFLPAFALMLLALAAAAVSFALSLSSVSIFI